MKNYLLALSLLVMTTLSSCAVVGGIFKAGIWVGIILVVVVVAVIFGLFRKK